MSQFVISAIVSGATKLASKKIAPAILVGSAIAFLHKKDKSQNIAGALVGSLVPILEIPKIGDSNSVATIAEKAKEDFELVDLSDNIDEDFGNVAFDEEFLDGDSFVVYNAQVSEPDTQGRLNLLLFPTNSDFNLLKLDITDRTSFIKDLEKLQRLTENIEVFIDYRMRQTDPISFERSVLISQDLKDAGINIKLFFESGSEVAI